jgi:hypothetical protein
VFQNVQYFLIISSFSHLHKRSKLFQKVSTTSRIPAAPPPEASGPNATSMATNSLVQPRPAHLSSASLISQNDRCYRNPTTNLVMPFKLVTTNFVMRCSKKVGTVWKSTLDKFERFHMMWGAGGCAAGRNVSDPH